MLLLELNEKMFYAWNRVSIHYLLDIVITVVMSLSIRISYSATNLNNCYMYITELEL